VCPTTKFERYYLSEKGQATAERRNARLRAARAARRAYRNARLNRDRSLSFDGRYSGRVVAGVPRVGDLRLSNFMGVSCG
jgi:hypothetical protein